MMRPQLAINNAQQFQNLLQKTNINENRRIISDEIKNQRMRHYFMSTEKHINQLNINTNRVPPHTNNLNTAGKQQQQQQQQQQQHLKGFLDKQSEARIEKFLKANPKPILDDDVLYVSKAREPIQKQQEAKVSSFKEPLDEQFVKEALQKGDKVDSSMLGVLRQAQNNPVNMDRSERQQFILQRGIDNWKVNKSNLFEKISDSWLKIKTHLNHKIESDQELKQMQRLLQPKQVNIAAQSAASSSTLNSLNSNAVNEEQEEERLTMDDIMNDQMKKEEKDAKDMAKDMFYVGQQYIQQKDYKKAFQCFELDLLAREQKYGVSSTEMALTLLQILQIARQVESLDYLSTVKMYFEMCEPMVTQNEERFMHLRLDLIYVRFGEIMMDLGEYQKAIDFNKRALYIREEYKDAHDFSSGNADQDNLILYKMHNNIAAGLTTQKEYKDALTEFKLAQKYKDDYVLRANMGICQQFLGQFDEAHKSLTSGLAMVQKELGKDSSQEIMFHIQFAELFESQKEYQTSIDHYLRAQIQMKKVHKDQLEKRPEYGLIQNSIAKCYMNTQNYEDALQNFQQAVKALKTTLGENHSMIGEIYNAIGVCHCFTGEFGYSLSCFKKALDNMQSQKEQDHLQQSFVYTSVGNVLEKQHNFEQAFQSHMRALEIRKLFYRNQPNNELVLASKEAIERLENHIKHIEKMKAEGKTVIKGDEDEHEHSYESSKHVHGEGCKHGHDHDNDDHHNHNHDNDNLQHQESEEKQQAHQKVQTKKKPINKADAFKPKKNII